MAEKSLNELPRDLRALLPKAMRPCQRENFDYAIELFNQMLAEPGLYECARRFARRRRKKAGSGRGFIKKMLSSAGSTPLVAKGQMALRKDPAEALQIAEQILNSDPEQLGGAQAGRRGRHRAGIAAAPPSCRWRFWSGTRPRTVNVAIQLANALADARAKSGAPRRSWRSFTGSTRPTTSWPRRSRTSPPAKPWTKAATTRWRTAPARTATFSRTKRRRSPSNSRIARSRPKTSPSGSSRNTRRGSKTEPNNLKLLRYLAELYTQKKAVRPRVGLLRAIKASDVGSDASLDRSIAETIGAEIRPPDFAARSERAGLRGQIGQAPGRETGLPTGRVPKARRAISDRPANPVRAGPALFSGGQDQRGHPGVSEVPVQSPPAHRRDELPGAVLCQAQDVRPRRAHLAGRPQGKTGLRRGEEGVDLQSRLRPREHGQERGSHRAIQAHLRDGHRLQGRRGEGGCVLRGQGKRRAEVRSPNEFDGGVYRSRFSRNSARASSATALPRNRLAGRQRRVRVSRSAIRRDFSNPTIDG